MLSVVLHGTSPNLKQEFAGTFFAVMIPGFSALSVSQSP